MGVCVYVCVCLPPSSSMHLATLSLLLKLKQHLVYVIPYLCVFHLWLCALKNKHFIIQLEPLIMWSIRKNRDVGLVSQYWLKIRVVFLLEGMMGQQPITSNPVFQFLPATNHKPISKASFFCSIHTLRLVLLCVFSILININ